MICNPAYKEVLKDPLQPLKDTIIAIKANNNSNASIDVIPLEDGDDLNEEGNADNQEDESEK